MIEVKEMGRSVKKETSGNDGKLTLLVAPDLKAWLESEAKDEQTTVTEIVRGLLVNYRKEKEEQEETNRIALEALRIEIRRQAAGRAAEIIKESKRATKDNLRGAPNEEN